ncbi:MAG: phenylalanine--tRNA ligase subunit alpha [Candidatus Spechtbacterales bacterium]|nr:phenylalanine--tRNA ligase subunit alpha [Candidatus Spechtbacterales bacterium]
MIKYKGKMDIKEIKKQVENALKKASNLEQIDEIWRGFLGRKGKVTMRLRELKDLPEAERKKQGKILNQLKEDLDNLFKSKIAEVQNAQYEKQIEQEWIDVTRPSYKKERGSVHPLSKTIAEIEDIFASMGFESIEGPQIENEWYNFEALNIPPNHPARDLWDTFWLKDGKKQKPGDKAGRTLLRTHTSPVQIHYMEKNNPPLRIIVPGPVFRYEATDASHEIEFYQLEGLMVDENISVANFRAVMREFLSRYFKKDINVRLRPSYFPFVEPGFEVDITCTNCEGSGCSVCSQTGWLELMGAGMVHPNVFEAAGYNPENYTGFAFGVGIDRLALMKHKIEDVRMFRSGDIRFLGQFK